MQISNTETLKTVGVAETWTLLYHVYKTNFLSKSRACNSTKNNLMRDMWTLCTCSVYILTLAQISNHDLENCRGSCGDTNILKGMTDRHTDERSNKWVLVWLFRVIFILMWLFYSHTSRLLVTPFKICMCLRNKSHLKTLTLSVKYSHLSTHLCVRTDGRADVWRRVKLYALLHFVAGAWTLSFAEFSPEDWALINKASGCVSFMTKP